MTQVFANSGPVSGPPRQRPTLGVVIRFKNSARTLPAVLAGLKRQTVQPDLILGIDNASTDDSAAILRAAGAEVLAWHELYSHPRVLNFALEHCPTDLVMMLSSHTVLNSTNALEQLAGALADPWVACASAKWDADPYYSDTIEWRELEEKGLKFCSIYTNSAGMVRRACWEEAHFDETMPTMEDGAWALEQVRRGRRCRRLALDFSYQRSGSDRSFVFAAVTFRMAARYGLRTAWLGPRSALRSCLADAWRSLTGSAASRPPEAPRHRRQFWAWLTWRWARAVE